MFRRITQFLRYLKSGIVQNVPPKYQACESCGVIDCTTEMAAICEHRKRAEAEELARRARCTPEGETTGMAGVVVGEDGLPTNSPPEGQAPNGGTRTGQGA